MLTLPRNDPCHNPELGLWLDVATLRFEKRLALRSCENVVGIAIKASKRQESTEMRARTKPSVNFDARPFLNVPWPRSSCSPFAGCIGTTSGSQSGASLDQRNLADIAISVFLVELPNGKPSPWLSAVERCDSTHMSRLFHWNLDLSQVKRLALQIDASRCIAVPCPVLFRRNDWPGQLGLDALQTICLAARPVGSNSLAVARRHTNI